MIAWLFALAAAAAPEPIAVRLEELGDVPLSDALGIAAAIGDAIEARTGARVAVDEPTWACEVPARCEDEVRARTGARIIVWLRVFGGAMSIHVEAERRPDHEKAELNVPARGPFEGQQVDAAVARLFPTGAAPANTLPAPAPAPIEAEPPWLAYGVWGGAFVVAAIGVGFGLSSRGAADQIAEGPLGSERYQPLADRQHAHGLAADVLLVTAAVGMAGGAVIWLLSP